MTESKAKEVAEILDMVGERLPGLVRTVRDIMFSEEAGRTFGKAVGAFYQELISSGLSSRDALEMSQQYLMTLQTAMRGVGHGPGPLVHFRYGPYRRRAPHGEHEAPEPPSGERGECC